MPAKRKSSGTPKASATGVLLVAEKIAPLVHYLRHEKVILDSHLAELYGVETGRLNEAVKRNIDRFPTDFMFQLAEYELETLLSQIAIAKNAESGSLRSQFATLNADSLRSQIVTLKRGQHRKYLPYAFTESPLLLHLIFPNNF